MALPVAATLEEISRILKRQDAWDEQSMDKQRMDADLIIQELRAGGSSPIPVGSGAAADSELSRT